MPKNNEKTEVTANQYGILLSEMVFISGDSYPNFCKSIGIKENYLDYLYFLEYLLYLSQKMLELEYSKDVIETVIRSSIESIVDCLHFIKSDSKDKYKEFMKENYNLIKKANYDIFEEKELRELVEQFEFDLKIEQDPIIDLNIFSEFANFITYHFEDVLNKKIKIINE